MIQNTRFDRCPGIQAMVTCPRPPQKVKFHILCLYSISSNLGLPSREKRQISTLRSHPPGPWQSPTFVRWEETWLLPLTPATGHVWKLAVAIPLSIHLHGRLPPVPSVHKYLSTEWVNVPSDQAESSSVNMNWVLSIFLPHMTHGAHWT